LKRIKLHFGLSQCWFLPLLLLLWLLRIYLYFSLQNSSIARDTSLHVNWFGLAFDAWLVLAVWILTSSLNALFSLWNKWPKRFLAPFIGSIVLFSCIALDQYYMTMFQPLDESFFFFSFEELMMIIGIEERLSVAMVISLVGIFALYFYLSSWLNKRLTSENKRTTFLFYASFLAFFMLPFAHNKFDNDLAKEGLANNRLILFVDQSVRYGFTPESDIKTIFPRDFKQLDVSFYSNSNENPLFPLWHKLPSKSSLDPYFNKTSNGKAPNVVFIIVESLSSDLCGERAYKTGHIMPFLDELSEKSLYFPNTFSTSQRTHNVLPATLSSVPNVMDGNVFQQIEFPNHWSLMRLLNKTYETRFFCGVYLEYLNMRGFMNYQKADYLVDDWSEEAIAHNEAIGSPWGFPDEDLFKQSFVDLPEENEEPLFDVFLTISTHDPFVYPNKSKYTKIVKRKSKRIKDREIRLNIAENAGKFGSFAYTDAKLRDYFETWKLRKDYENTIFIITGDHGTELYAPNKLTKYNVPILIYSPLLKEGKLSKSIVSHLDITPTIYNFLRVNYNKNLPHSAPFVGKELVIDSAFNTKRSLVFTTNKLKTSELFYNGFAYLENTLFSVNEDFEITEEPDVFLKNKLKKQLELYQLFSHYTIRQNHLVPPKEHAHWFYTKKWKEKTRLFAKIEKEHTSDKCIPLGTYTFSRKTDNALRIQLFTELYCETQDDLNTLADLVVSSKKLIWLDDRLILFKAIRPTFVEKFKPHAKNKIAYTIECDGLNKSKLLKKNELFFTLYNKERIEQPFKSVGLVISN
jgi:glucan phosphoethanolaminetransferase (alkaline phosphatase superfamily)